MRLLLFDSTSLYPANPLFAEALQPVGELCGFEHRWFDEDQYVPRGSLLRRAIHRVAGRPLGYRRMNRSFRKLCDSFRPDLILITSGKHLNQQTVHWAKEHTGAVMVNYATDDPFNRAVTTKDFYSSISCYDFYACTKRAIIPEVQAAGCPGAFFVPFGYKPEHHFPERPMTLEERRRFDADVAFVGGCDGDRVPIMSQIPRARPGLRLNLFGWFWDRYSSTRPYFRGAAFGRDQRLAFSGAKIVINLVRRANRDTHGPRTFEIPACGGFMLTDRTDEQCSFLAEDKEAVYFSSTEEMIDKIRYYLAHDSARRRIAEAGYRRITSGKNTYADRLRTIVATVCGDLMHDQSALNR